MSLDAEIGFINDHRDVMAIDETVLAGMLHTVADTAPAAGDVLGRTVSDKPTGPSERLVSARTRPHGNIRPRATSSTR